jgi:hypothetical protein
MIISFPLYLHYKIFSCHLEMICDKNLTLTYITNRTDNKEKFNVDNHGEVFTPLNIIDDMLNSLDSHFIKKNGYSIFEEKNFKWLDPACGIGNYLIIIYYIIAIELHFFYNFVGYLLASYLYTFS